MTETPIVPTPTAGPPFVVDHLKVERLARLRALNNRLGGASVGGAHRYPTFDEPSNRVLVLMESARLRFIT
jgi:hypothetical protein